jgi:hypothetical protein
MHLYTGGICVALVSDTSAEDDIEATRRYVGHDAEVVGGGAENGHFTGARPNRQQRRESLKHDERWIVKTISVTFENGRVVDLDTNKVMIVDKETHAQLFDYVIEGS